MPAIEDPRIRRGMERQFALRRTRLAAGERTLGWKVGFGAPAALQKFRIQAPLVGFMLQSALRDSGSSVSLSGWTRPQAEPEIAVHIGHDLGAGADRAQAQASIAGLGPAIELADVDHPPEEVEDILACNIYHRAVIVGRCERSRAGGGVAGLHGRVARNGAEFAQTADPQALTGDLVDIVRHVADTLAACGETLRTGQIIIAGSIVPPLRVEAGESVAFRLDPLGEVSIRFAASRP